MKSTLVTRFTHLSCLSFLVLTSVFPGCGDGQVAVESPSAEDKPEDGSNVDPRMYKSPEWIDTYDPESTSVGYTLALYKRRTPMLMNMDGSVVRAWHDVRAAGRARLLPNGHLAVIGESGDLEEYNWERELTWSFSLPDSETFLHHDFIQVENGNFLLLAHDPVKQVDFLLEVDRSGEVVWRWNSAEHLEEDFARTNNPNNKTHINSIHELPSNRWFDGGHDGFRPGNILLSARNLNALYIVSRPEGTVTWRFFDGLDFQHEALMIPPGVQGAGNILLFNNGYHDLAAYRQSAILEINPVDETAVWEYRRRGFYSSTGGTQQSLPNGNLLVTSSQGGRVFELTRDGRIVWQWSPPFMPMRATRYAPDFSPQLRELGPASVEPIHRRDPNSFIDRDLYMFSLPHQTRRVRLATETKYVLKEHQRCQVLQIPEGSQLQLGFGAMSRRRAEEPDTPFVGDEGPVLFRATLRLLDGSELEPILDQQVAISELRSNDPQSRLTLLTETVPLGSLGAEEIELCLAVSTVDGGPTLGEFVWEEPLILSPNVRAPINAEAYLDREALEKQEKHLKAIGYIN